MVGVSLLLAAGCGRPPGILFEPPVEPLRWPGPPEPPRIEWVGQLVTDQDLKPGKSFGKVLGEKVFGADPARSMLSPYSLCLDDAERLLVCDTNAQAVHVFGLETRRYERWGGVAGEGDDPAESPFDQPVGIAWDERQRRVLVADSVAAVVLVLAPNGMPVERLGAGVLERPGGIAVDPVTGHVFVADTAAHKVVVFDGGGRLVRRLGGRGTEPGRFNFPTALAFDREGRLYVSDSLNFRVQVFDRALQPVRQVGRQGDLPGFFSQPKGIAVDGAGRLYVVDAHFETVQMFDDGGRLLLSFGREGAQPGQFWLPAGIHVDDDDRVWVADTYNRRVQVFQYLAEAP